MGSQLGRMLAITLPLAGIGIAAPFLAPALLPGAAVGAAGGGVGAGVGGGAATGLATATPAIAAGATPGIAAGAAPGAVAGAAPGAIGGAAPGAVASGGGAAAGGGSAAAGGAAALTPGQQLLAQGIQSGSSLTSGMLNQQFNQQAQMPQIPTIRAPAQTVVPFGGAATDFTTPGMGLALQPPGAGPSPDAGPGSAMAMNTAQNLFPNAFNNPDPFAAYSLAA